MKINVFVTISLKLDFEEILHFFCKKRIMIYNRRIKLQGQVMP